MITGPARNVGRLPQTSEDTTRRDTAMHARQMAAMAEATRLTRQGRLIEATALIQQTLASPAVTRRAPDAPSARGDTTGADPFRLAYPLPHSPQPKRIESPPAAAASGLGHEAVGGPV